MERDLVKYLDHTNGHVIDQIKKQHPEWIAADGGCQSCVQYYEKQLSGEIEDTNIGPEGRRRRKNTGILALIAGTGLGTYFIFSNASQAARMWTFLPIFAGIFCLLQAKQRTCSILAEIGSRDMDQGRQKITNAEITEKLRARGRKIIFKAVIFAAALTAVFVYLRV
ncbi:MAG: hypothetical protein H6757_00845 [Candidatus Omnitrophica bacterium]|nr:hypothetical protein [Candidatus Omnitrophota bacterium]